MKYHHVNNYVILATYHKWDLELFSYLYEENRIKEPLLAATLAGAPAMSYHDLARYQAAHMGARMLSTADAEIYVGGKEVLQELRDMGLAPARDRFRSRQYDKHDLDHFIDLAKPFNFEPEKLAAKQEEVDAKNRANGPG